MHYVCFHDEFEHGGADVDLDRGAGGCPSGVLPSAAPSESAQELLREAAEAVRRPYDPDGWTLTFEQPGGVRLERPGARIRLVAVDAPARKPR